MKEISVEDTQSIKREGVNNKFSGQSLGKSKTSKAAQDLQAIKEIVLENNKMLHTMKRAARISTFFNIFKLILILIPIILAFIYLPPYLRQLFEVWAQVQGIGDQFGVGTSPGAIPDISGFDIDAIKGFLGQ